MSNKIRLVSKTKMMSEFARFVSAETMQQAQVFYSHILSHAGKEVDSREIVVILTEAMIRQSMFGVKVPLDLGRTIDAITGGGGGEVAAAAKVSFENISKIQEMIHRRATG